jgi:hypothetical protein
MTTQLPLPLVQRWRERRERYRPAGERINPAEYAVATIPEPQARGFVVEHHYSATWPANRLSVGLFRGARLVGVAAFSQGMNNATVPKHTGLADHLAGVELGRFVLLDEVAGNGESWFLARAFRALRTEKPGVEAVVSCSDPLPRLTAAGQLVKPGHIGTIYQALGAAYRGRTKARRELILPTGQPFSERAISKLRAQDQGHAYATDQLVRLGAPRPAPGEDLGAWLGRLIDGGFFAFRRHPGNHVYAFGLTREAKSAGADLPALPYPKLAA